MPPALQFLVLTFAGWVNRHQDDLIEYLREENRVLREYLGPRPLRLDRRPASATRCARPQTRPASPQAGRGHRHPGHDPSLVPETDRQEIRRQRLPPSRAADDAQRSRRARGQDGGRESAVGLHTDPRRALEPRAHDRPDHGEADLARPRDRPGSRTEPTHALEDVPTGALGTAWRPAICSRSRC